MRNVRARDLPVPTTEVGALLDRLGGPDDPLRPSSSWSPMVLSGPLALGVGLHGTHTPSIEPAGPDRCGFRHVLAVRLLGWGRVTWPLVARRLPGAVVDDLLHSPERRAVPLEETARRVTVRHGLEVPT